MTSGSVFEEEDLLTSSLTGFKAIFIIAFNNDWIEELFFVHNCSTIGVLEQFLAVVITFGVVVSGLSSCFLSLLTNFELCL